VEHDSDPAHGDAGHGGAGHGHGGHAGHGHGGHAGHGHGGHGLALAGSSQRAFVVSTALNLGFVFIEFTYGAIAASTALVADAAHNLGDVLGLLLAWGASRLHQRGPTRTRTYGFRKSTVLASLTNAVLLVFTVGAVVWEALSRFGEPRLVNGQIVLWVAALGVAINFGSALMFMRGAKRDLNLRGAYLHMLADAAVSLAVVFAGLVISVRPAWVWVDPVVSIGVSGVVLWSAWGLLREALHLTLDGVPEHLDADAVKATLAGLPGVVLVADLHVWAISTSESALTAHLVVDERASPSLAQEAGLKVREVYGIGHVTIQIDAGAPDQKCAHC
jgi:cobalt-zinc-cadmium efflux system protein